MAPVVFRGLQSLNEIRPETTVYVENGTKPSPDDYELEAEFFMEYVIAHDLGIEDLDSCRYSFVYVGLRLVLVGLQRRVRCYVC